MLQKKRFDKATLKKAYKTISLKFHPDKNKSPHATAAFQVIANAYEILDKSTVE